MEKGGIVAESPKDQKKSILEATKAIIGTILGREVGNLGCVSFAIVLFLAVVAVVGGIGTLLGAGDDVVKPVTSIYHWFEYKLFPEKAEADRIAREKKAEADRIAREKKAEEARLGNLVAGVTLSSFRSTLGDDKPEYRPRAPGHLTREIYVSRYAYVQAWVDAGQSVVAFSVTARTKDFHPAFAYESQKIVLGQSSIADAFGPLSSEGQMALGGTCPAKTAYYYEALKGYWSGSQTVAVGIASVGEVTDKRTWSSLCTGQGGRIGEAAQRLADCSIEDFDPKNYENFSCFADSPAGKRFRQDTIINTFAITKPDGRLPQEGFYPKARLAPHEEELS
jgi:hypothetical protein